MVTLTDAVNSSYRNFHAKGVSYLCLSRSLPVTHKLYLFEDSSDDVPVAEVVHPHDHRYPFTTTCVAGAVRNLTYTPSDSGMTFTRYDYRSPLLDSAVAGFTEKDTVRLSVLDDSEYRQSQSYTMNADEVHTIRVRGGTALYLVQYADTVPVDQPTSTFMGPNESVPSLDSGLYEKFTNDQMLRLLREVSELELPHVAKNLIRQILQNC